MNKLKLINIEGIMRLGVFLTFIGHGIFALGGKEGWLPYLGVFGFSEATSYTLMKGIGVLDICVALIILIKPLKPVVLWAVFWAFSAALMRPISGEPVLDFIERGANWALPLALYFILRQK